MQPADGAGSTDGCEPTLLCPSAACEPGAVLVGMVGGDGRVGYVLPQLPVSDRFVAFARAGGAPERRFRFASPCVEDACAHWTGHGCGVIDDLVRTVAARHTAHPLAGAPPLPNCSIRTDCRWFHQSGLGACAVCPLVVTDRKTLIDPVARQRAITHSPPPAQLSSRCSGARDGPR